MIIKKAEMTEIESKNHLYSCYIKHRFKYMNEDICIHLQNIIYT